MGKNGFKTAVLLGALTGVFLALGQVLGGQQGLVIAFIFAAAMNFASYWYSDKIVLKMYRAQPADERTQPRLVGIVRRLTQQAGLPMPKVYVIPDATPNAFATGRNPEHAAVAATEGLLRLLDDRELAGVVAHELAHIKNRDILIGSVAATIAGAIGMIATMLQWAAIFGMGGRDRGNAFVAILLAIVTPIIAAVIQMAISRSREYAADAEGARISRDPMGLADALRKISRGVEAAPMQPTPGHEATAHMFIANPFRSRDVMKLLSTHPPVEERIGKLEAMGRLR